MKNDHHRREVVFLISFLLLFGIIFLISIINLNRSTPVLGIGIRPEVENWIILVLSAVAIFRVFLLLVRH